MKCRGRRATPPPGISVSVIGPYPRPPPLAPPPTASIAQFLPPADQRGQRGALHAIVADEEYVLSRHRPDQDWFIAIVQTFDVLPRMAEVLRIVDRVPADPAFRAP